MTSDKKENQSVVPQRRRGRPTGKNRVPLSLKERRARNALYERERRCETADAMAQLTEAVGCDPNMSTADVMATAIFKIQKSTESTSDESIEDIRHINAKLKFQIAMLQAQLGLDDESIERLGNEDFATIATNSSSDYTDSSDQSHSDQPSRKQMKRCCRHSDSGHRTKRPNLRTETSVSSESADDSSIADIPLDLLTDGERDLIASLIEENMMATTAVD